MKYAFLPTLSSEDHVPSCSADQDCMFDRAAGDVKALEVAVCESMAPPGRNILDVASCPPNNP